MPDNDEAGRTWCKAVEKSLKGVAASVKVVELDGLPEKGDVSDWLDNGGTKEKLLKQAAKSKIKLNLTPLTEIESKEVEWFWPNKIPANTLTILSGDPGATKSFLTIYMAARVSTGQPWPDCPEIPAKKGEVILFSDEDSASSVIKPRLEAHGADVSKVFITQGVKGNDSTVPFNLTQHLKELEDVLNNKPDTRLLVLDPITAYMGKTNANSNTEVRSTFGPLIELAEKHEVTVIGINHHNKRQDLAAIYRILGSTAFAAQARSVWAVIIDKNDRDLRIFCLFKSNYGINPTGLTYRIIEGVVTFDAEPWTGHIDDLTDTKHFKVDQAADWLKTRLQEGEVNSTIIKEEGNAAGFNNDLLDRAKKKLGIITNKSGFGGKWSWRLPEND